jgi:heavy metal translocating P-type ATPase
MLEMKHNEVQTADGKQIRHFPSEKPTSQKRWPQRLQDIVRQYPVPTGSLLLLLISLVCWLAGRADIAQWALLVIVLGGGIPLLWEMVTQMLRREFSIDLIAILAISGSLWMGEYLAGAFIVLMLSGGKALEAYALRRAHSSLSELAERAPRQAHMWEGEQLIDVPAEKIEAGMQVVVKPGEIVPVDGVIEVGESNVSEADLTGEPLPVHKVAGMLVLSGSINLDSILHVRASKSNVESKYAQIVKLVAEAQKQKAPIHRLADRYSVVFTVVTILFALAAWLLSKDPIYALAVLVVATPCPLILATPIAIMSGIDVAARHGIIVKSGAAIEQLGEVNVAVFDKTGTLTLGIPHVTEVLFHEGEQLVAEERTQREQRLLRLAASVEQLSTHILAKAVVDAAQEQQQVLSPVSDFQEVFGKGVQSCVVERATDEEQGSTDESIVVAVGNRSFMQQLAITLPAILLEERERRTEQGQIASFVALNGECVALIVLKDVPRPDLVHLTPALKREGIKKTVLLTGDSEVVAQQIGEMAQIDQVVARCLPEQKVQVIREYVREGEKVLMVGDGVNDAPALASATVGMALGAQGLTAAASAADAVLLSTEILRVVSAVHIGRRALHIAQQGIWLGMGLSVIAMGFAAFGAINPAVGAILQEGIDVLVILNALRVGRSAMKESA